MDCGSRGRFPALASPATNTAGARSLTHVLPRLAVRILREPLLPMRDGGGNGRIGGGVAAEVGVRDCPDIGAILVRGRVAQVLKVTRERGRAV